MLSSLTGVDLPAAADLCTRVPTCIRTEMGDVSSCLTRIIWSRDEKGIAKPASHEYSKHTECSRDGDHLVKRIEELPKTILELDEADSVSSSVIEIDLKGPEHTSFTLTDLPGLVRVAGEEESETIICKIDTLVEKYMRNELCIMLCVLPAEEDFHNHDIL
eukprot:Selendium_serpulae@DN6159_c2_g1_i19.p2